MTALRIECDQLRKDNSKLIGMLKSTKEFENHNFNTQDGGYAVQLPGSSEEQWVPGDAFSQAY